MNTGNREKFLEENLGLVHLLARRFKGRGIDYEDLFQAGCEGLCKAFDRFEPQRGLAFSTYAVPVILGEIKKLFREGGSIKVSRSLKETAMRLLKLQQAMEEEAGHSVTIRELARRAGLGEEAVQEALLSGQQPLSLSASEEENGHPTEIPCESKEEEISVRLSLEQELHKLEESDQKLLLFRYYQGMTQADTAKQLQMTQVQVSRREKKLLLLLREALSG